MTAILQDPRRTPRVPVRMHVDVGLQDETVSGFTEDVGPAGCLVHASRPLVQGADVRVRIFADPIGRLTVEGRVLWARGPRAGIAFGGEQVAAAAAWFGRLLADRPELAAMVARLPTRLTLDTVLYLLPPSPDLRFGPDELAVIRAIDRDVTVGQIAERCHLPPHRAARAVFALLQSNVLTLAAARAVEPWQWNPIAYPPVVRTRPAAPAQPVEPEPALEGAAEAAVEVAAEADAGDPTAPAAPVGRVALRAVSAPAALHALLRGKRAMRSEEAQDRLDRARDALSRGRVTDAIGHLRDALRIDPRDAEISGILAQVAFTRRVA